MFKRDKASVREKVLKLLERVGFFVYVNKFSA